MAQSVCISAQKPGWQYPNPHFLKNIVIHNTSSNLQGRLPVSSCFCMQDPVHVDEDINTCPSLCRHLTRRAAALTSGFWISVSKYTLHNSREEHDLAPPKGKHRCLAPNPWNFLNSWVQKGRGQRLSSTIYFDSFSTNCSKPLHR